MSQIRVTPKLREFLRRREEEKFRFFVPNGKQSEAIKMIADPNNFISIFSGGNGAGKTYLMINVLANIIWPGCNEWFKEGIFKEWNFPKRIRIGTESGNVKESGVIEQAINEWWPKGRFEGTKAGLPYTSQYKTDTGFIIDIKSYEQETREWESATLGMCVFDEPPPKDKFSASVSRMRKGGILGIFMSPLSQAGWIFDDLVNSHDQKCAITYADLEDNCKTHGLRGTLEHTHIQKLIDNMDPEEIDARVHGKAMHLQSVILGSAFKRNYHVIDDNIQPPPGSQHFLVVDPARGKPWAMGWGWIDLKGRIVFTDEYPIEDWTKCKETKLSLRDYADLIHRFDAQRFCHYKIIDRHFANARNDYGTTLKMDLEEKFGIEFQDSYNCENEIEVGIQKVKDMLRLDESREVDTLNYARLQIKARCKNIIRSLDRWDRNPDTLKPNVMSVFKDHFDLVRYACMANLHVDQPLIMPPKKDIYAIGR